MGKLCTSLWGCVIVVLYLPIKWVPLVLSRQSRAPNPGRNSVCHLFWQQFFHWHNYKARHPPWEQQGHFSNYSSNLVPAGLCPGTGDSGGAVGSVHVAPLSSLVIVSSAKHRHQKHLHPAHCDVTGDVFHSTLWYHKGLPLVCEVLPSEFHLIHQGFATTTVTF